MKTTKMPIRPGIYRIINRQNGKFYIGSTGNLYNRKASHFSKLNLNKHPNAHLQNSWNKYGEENFDFEIVSCCPFEYTLRLEQWFMDVLKPDYNIRKKVSSNAGIKFKKESTALKKRAAQKVNWGNPEYRRKQTQTRSIPILCFKKDTDEFLGEFKSAKIAGEQLECCPSSIAKVLTRKSASAKGYYFRYKDDQKNIKKCITRDILCIFKMDRFIGEFQTIKQASEHLRVAPSYLSQILLGRNPKTVKYKGLRLERKTQLLII